MLKNKRKVIFLFAGVIVFIILLYSFLFTNNSNLKYHSDLKLSSLSPEINELFSNATENAKNYKKSNMTIFSVLKKDKISSKTPLELNLAYSDGSRKELLTSMPESFIGLEIEELEDILEDWEIEKYQPGDLLVLKNINKIDAPKKEYCITIKDKKIAIFYDRECKNLKQLTEIKIDKLAEKEIEILKNGIIAKSDEELLTILESLKSINED
ncbi:MAG: BofC C-terminal domain-containing protein [Bacillota bacterium]